MRALSTIWIRSFWTKIFTPAITRFLVTPLPAHLVRVRKHENNIKIHDTIASQFLQSNSNYSAMRAGNLDIEATRVTPPQTLF